MIRIINSNLLSILGKIIDLITLIITIIMIVYTLFVMSDMPDIVPTHINVDGDIDGYGKKSSILVLPILGLISYVGLSILQRKPQIFNYPIKVTDDNASVLYSIGAAMMRFVKTMIVFLFAFVTYVFVNLSRGIQIKYTSIVILGGCLLLTIGVIVYIIRMRGLKND